MLFHCIFLEGFFGAFYRILERKWTVQNLWKTYTFAAGRHFWDLGTFWHKIRTILVRFGWPWATFLVPFHGICAWTWPGLASSLNLFPLTLYGLNLGMNLHGFFVKAPGIPTNFLVFPDSSLVFHGASWYKASWFPVFFYGWRRRPQFGLIWDPRLASLPSLFSFFLRLEVGSRFFIKLSTVFDRLDVVR